jgi:putative addiction module component (TIGR02574 family)
LVSFLRVPNGDVRPAAGYGQIMNLATALAEIAELSIDDRLCLVEAIWDSIAAEAGEAVPSVDEQQELERRLAAHRTNPEQVVPWEEVKAQALARSRY